MLTTPHILVALVIVKNFPHPFEAIVLSLLSHFLLDFFVPHWNPHLYTEMNKKKKISSFSLKVIIIDSLISLISFSFFALKLLPNYNQLLIAGLAGIVAVLPDLIEIPYYFLHSKNKFLIKYVRFEHQKQMNANIFWGLITQILTVAACLKELFY